MDKFISRLNRLVNSMFACRLDYVPANQLVADGWIREELNLVLQPAPEARPWIRHARSDAFGFPVIVHGELHGMAVATGLVSPSASNLEKISDLVALVLPSAISELDRIEVLTGLEKHLQTFRQNSNVIPLRAPKAQIPIRPEAFPDFEVNAGFSPAIGNRPLLVLAPAEHLIEKVALEIHGLSNRWAFVRYEDLPADAFTSSQAFNQLGSITILIKDVSRMDLAAQENLAAILQSTPQDAPHVIAGTTRAPAELDREPRLHSALRGRLATAQLQWTGHFDVKDIVASSLANLLDLINEGATPDFGHDRGQLVPFNPKVLRQDPDAFH